jgi:hypothetical protein
MIRNDAHLPWAHPDPFQRFFQFSTLLMISISWGIRFSLKLKPSSANAKSFDTVCHGTTGAEPTSHPPRFVAYESFSRSLEFIEYLG